uniref:Fimbrial assembly protein n=1 Tax=Schlesneria paludicola TaxID=360056 RepID=A0A7C4LP27_9PLAN
MADLLIVTGERQRMAAAQVAVEGGRARWLGGWTATWPDGVSPTLNPKAAGEWLRSQWSGAGLSARLVWIVVPREEIVLRHLELPVVPDEELADLVRFQAAARSAVPLDQTSLDFLPLPAVSSRPGRDVLAATLPNAVVDRFRLTLKAADRELAGVTCSSTALAEWTLRQSRRRELEGARSDATRSGAHALMATLTRRTIDPGHAELTVVLDGPRIEMALIAERQLVFGHAARTAATTEDETSAALQAEVSRCLVAAGRTRPDLHLQQAWLVGGHAAQAKVLQEQIGCAVDLVDSLKPSELGECPAALRPYAADVVLLSGAALAHLPDAAPNIDFLHPRHPPPRRDPRKQQLAVGAAAALFTAFVVLGGAQLWLRRLDSQIASLRSELASLNSVVSRGQRDLLAAKAVEEWDVRNIDQLQQILELEELLPGDLKRPYLSNYQFAPATGDALATITLAGAAQTREHVETFQKQLREHNYRVKPSPLTVSRDDDYPSAFNFSADRLAARKGAPQAK